MSVDMVVANNLHHGSAMEGDVFLESQWSSNYDLLSFGFWST